jgi:hypothetical protein
VCAADDIVLALREIGFETIDKNARCFQSRIRTLCDLLALLNVTTCARRNPDVFDLHKQKAKCRDVFLLNDKHVHDLGLPP